MDALHPSERKKILEIMKEKERNVPNMDWMYTKEKPDREDYLLGKKVDKHFETEDKPEEPIPQADVFGERIKANITLDMQAKMREDPLFAIKKVEEESRRKLLQNPIKMKQLKKMIEQQKSDKKKKKKKHKHRKDNSDSEDDLVSQYLSILNKKHSSSHGSIRDKEKRDSSKGDRTRKTSRRDKGENSHHGNSRKDNSKHSRTDNSRNDHSKTRTLLNRSSEGEGIEDSHRNRSEERHKSEEDNTEEHEEKRRIPSPVGHRRRRYDSSSSEERHPKAYGLIKIGNQATKTDELHAKSSTSRSPNRITQSPGHHRNSHIHHSRSRSRSPKRSRTSGESHRHHHGESRSPVKSKARRPSPKRKLTAEEREKKLAEMMDNAKWRDEQRRLNVKQYKQEEKKEQEYENRGRGSGAKFLNPMLSKHASESSIEDRLKRNKYNIQRRKTDLEKNFTEK